VADPRALPQALEQWRRSLATGQPLDLELPLRGADGRFHPFLTRVMPLKDDEGRVALWFGTNTDIAELKQAQEELRHLKDELELRVERRTAELAAANRELEDFASIVAHDLKAPLRGVATISTWLQTDYANKLDEKGREWLAQMNQRVVRMDRMIEEILEYSRLGRSEKKHEPVALAKLVLLVVQDLAPPPHVRIRVAPGLPVVQGEPVRLRQVFQNLIGNAIKYVNKPEGDIRVDWADVDASWEFSVTDNGPGIEEKHFERIFKMFQTLAPKDRTNSTGVGLALVKRIVEHAGGRVWVKSRVGEGSTFHFTWPKGPQAGTAETLERMAA
jgi:signal transduction histidine kinase